MWKITNTSPIHDANSFYLYIKNTLIRLIPNSVFSLRNFRLHSVVHLNEYMFLSSSQICLQIILYIFKTFLLLRYTSCFISSMSSHLKLTFNKNNFIQLVSWKRSLLLYTLLMNTIYLSHIPQLSENAVLIFQGSNDIIRWYNDSFII